jgi:hypothetical protein
MDPSRIASLCALPESYPMIVILPTFFDSLTPFSTPIAEPSLAPKKPLISGFEAIIAFVMSVDLS